MNPNSPRFARFSGLTLAAVLATAGAVPAAPVATRLSAKAAALRPATIAPAPASVAVAAPRPAAPRPAAPKPAAPKPAWPAVSRPARDAATAPRVTVRTDDAVEGSPLAVREGFELSTSLVDPGDAAELDAARPLALASGDFDGDGVADLVTGYAGPSGGFVTLRRGNVDAIYPNTAEAEERRADGTFVDEPFLPETLVFATGGAPEMLGAGDFDADGRMDVVAATRGAGQLVVLRGDGAGRLGAPESVALPGSATALAVGDVNRRDGLADVVVGVAGARGAAFLVFEGPEGAMRAEPEAIALHAPASSVAIGRVDEDGYDDIAAAAGRELVVAYGRDRELFRGADERAAVKPAVVDARAFESELRSVAIGDFAGDGRPSVAALDAEGAVTVLAGAVTRDGENAAGASPKASPEASPKASARTSKAAKALAGRVSLAAWSAVREGTERWQGATQLVAARVSAGGFATPLVVDPEGRAVRALDAAGGAAALKADSGVAAVLPMRLGPAALDGLVVLGGDEGAHLTAAPVAPGSTITVNDLGDFTGNHSSTDTTITLREAIALANGALAKSSLSAAEQALVSGTPAASQLDQISFNIPNAVGGTMYVNGINDLSVADATIIDGTTEPGSNGAAVIQIDRNSPSRLNGFALLAGSAGSTVRGLHITQFSGNGVSVASNNDMIEACQLGVGYGLGNGIGVFVGGVTGTTIGGTTTAARNVISGNQTCGVAIDSSSASGNKIQGNYIGTDVGGTNADPNGWNNSTDPTGVLVRGASGTAISGNVISGNVGEQVKLTGTNGLITLLQGNRIGTRPDGESALLSNGARTGVLVSMNSVTIGGTAVGAGNIVSGNFLGGIVSTGASLVVNGNLIGTDDDGLQAIGDASDGVRISGGSATIGDGTTNAGNVISGNIASGVRVDGGTASIQGNKIGVGIDGTTTLGNLEWGVYVAGTASSVTIGGSASASANVIMRNSFGGVGVDTGSNDTSVTVQGNVISSNLGDGVRVFGAGNDSSIAVKGNKIGVNAAGTAVSANSQYGVYADFGNINIGGSVAADGNVISGNGSTGVYVKGSGATIRWNKIGTDAAGNSAIPNSEGIRIERGSSGFTTGATISSNVVSGNNGSGIYYDDYTSATISGNYVGTNATGTAKLGNGGDGIFVDSSLSGSDTVSITSNVVGGNDRGVVSTAAGVQLSGNWIGTDKTGAVDLGNAGDGVVAYFFANSFSQSSYLHNSTIAFNGGAGVNVANFTTRFEISQNSIYSNAGPGIDLNGDGVTDNDAGDGDSGGNKRLNYPTFTVAASGDQSELISGSIDTDLPNGTQVQLEFFYAPGEACDPVSGARDGRSYLTSTTVNVNGSGDATFSFTTFRTVGRVTATATDQSGNTSEFSPCAGVTCPSTGAFWVFFTSDSGPGTLRQAIIDANSCPGANTIKFAISNASILPRGPLPAITEDLTIDGTTAPGTVVAGVPRVELNGMFAGTSVNGLSVTAPNPADPTFVVVKGLAINQFSGNGIDVQGGQLQIEGCFIGVNAVGTPPFGTTAKGNGGHGINMLGSAYFQCGGTTAAARNVISGNGNSGITLSFCTFVSGDCQIQGNYIGTNAAGTADLGNAQDGIRIGDSIRVNVGGDRTGGEGNVISGNGSDGIQGTGSSGLRMIADGNYIGVGADGTTAIGNDGHGIFLNGPTGNFVNGSGPNGANTIANNGGDGIYIQAGTSTQISANSIYNNGGLGIDLGTNGVTPNDAAPDSDTGANNLLNYPVLTSTAISGSNLVIQGTYTGPASDSFTLNFYKNPACDASGNGEGKIFLFTSNVVTNAAGTATINTSYPVSGFPSGLAAGDVITAMAIDESTRDSSEFSACSTVTAACAAAAVTGNPTNQTACAGQTVSFTAGASGTPTPTVQWQVSTDGGTNFTNVTGNASAATTTLSFTAAGQNGNKYRAVFTNTCSGTQTATTTAATLTVNTAASVTGNPTSQTVCAGATATFTASASGTPTPTVQWQVSTDGGTNFTNITGNASATTTTLSFAAAANQNGNQYRAVFTNSCTTATTTGATLTVNAATAVAAPANQTVCLAATATFTAAPTGTGPFTYQWRRGTTNLTNGTKYGGVTTGTLSVFDAGASDAGSDYNVVVTGSCGGAQTSGNATLAINPNGCFDSQFAAGSNPTRDWTNDVASRGAWSLDGTGNYATATASSSGLSSISHVGNYGSFDYRVDWVRTGTCATCPTSLYIRGVPQPVQPPYQRWFSCYQFSVTADGRYSVWLYNGTGAAVAVQAWTPLVGVAINAAPAANWLQVTIDPAQPTMMHFVVNGVEVAMVPTNGVLTSGQVGVSMMRNTTVPGGLSEVLKIDRARLGPHGALPAKVADPASEWSTFVPLSADQKRLNQEALDAYKLHPELGGTPDEPPAR